MIDHDIQAQFEDLCRRAQQQNRLFHSPFLDPMRQMEALNIANAKRLRPKLWGGYPEAERKMIFLLPDYLDEAAIEQSPEIAALTLQVSAPNLSHRDYLGSILGTGIKRSCVGDILVDKTHALVYCESKMADYLKLSLTKIARAQVSIEDACKDDWKHYETDGESIRCNVASLRLDSVVAAAFQASRTNVQSWIETGDVSLNWTPCLQSSKSIQVGDTISVRRKGRAIVENLGGQSRKGRLFLDMTRFTKK